MSIWEKMGFKKKVKELTPEEKIIGLTRQILELEKNIDRIRENLGGGSGGPEVKATIEGFENRIKDLNDKIVDLGGKPVGPSAFEEETRRMGFVPAGSPEDVKK